MTHEELQRIKAVVDERSWPGEWIGSDGQKVRTDNGTLVVTCQYNCDANFVEEADTSMGKLIDEVYRLRAIARTLGIGLKIPKNEIKNLLDGDDE